LAFIARDERTAFLVDHLPYSFCHQPFAATRFRAGHLTAIWTKHDQRRAVVHRLPIGWGRGRAKVGKHRQRTKDGTAELQHRLDITANKHSSCRLAPQQLATLKFGDTTPTNNWILDPQTRIPTSTVLFSEAFSAGSPTIHGQ